MHVGVSVMQTTAFKKNIYSLFILIVMSLEHFITDAMCDNLFFEENNFLLLYNVGALAQ